MIFTTASGCSYHKPASSLKPLMKFFLNSFIDLLGKYFELLSPFVNHKILDIWFHIQVSLSERILISALSPLTQELSPLLITLDSALINIFFFSSNSFQTFPKQFLFHHVKSLPHFSTFFKTLLVVSELTVCTQAASTISLQLGSESHISSNLKFFFHRGSSSPDGFMNKGRWSDEVQERWLNLIPGNLRN